MTENDLMRPPCWGPNENGDMMVDLSVEDYRADLRAALAEAEQKGAREAACAALMNVAGEIETRRAEHWQKHLRDHPHSDGRSCPVDYGKHDAYHEAAQIVRDRAAQVGSEVREIVWECGPHANAWSGHDARCRQVQP